MMLKNKRGDINLSFGVIFSVILIAVFVFAAIYSINFFLDYSERLQIGRFYDGLQREVSASFFSQSTENKRVKISLPSSIEKVCFANLSVPITGAQEDYEAIRDWEFEDANMFLIPGSEAQGMPYKKIEKINLSEIIKDGNPHCIYSDEEFILTKKLYDRSVLIK